MKQGRAAPCRPHLGEIPSFQGTHALRAPAQWLTCRVAHTSTITGLLSPDLYTGRARPTLTFNGHFKILSPDELWTLKHLVKLHKKLGHPQVIPSCPQGLSTVRTAFRALSPQCYPQGHLTCGRGGPSVGSRPDLVLARVPLTSRSRGMSEARDLMLESGSGRNRRAARPVTSLRPARGRSACVHR